MKQTKIVFNWVLVLNLTSSDSKGDFCLKFQACFGQNIELTFNGFAIYFNQPVSHVQSGYFCRTWRLDEFYIKSTTVLLDTEAVWAMFLHDLVR